MPPADIDLLIEGLCIEEARLKVFEDLLVMKRSGEAMGLRPRILVLDEWIQVLLESGEAYAVSLPQKSLLPTDAFNRTYIDFAQKAYDLCYKPMQ